ncbi:MAG: hypothetical protein WCK11_02740 [Candidatus Falkowbacteria bacterium]
MLKISSLGSSKGVAGDVMYNAMAKVGRLLAESGHVVMTGGFSGAGMEAPCKGATESGGEAIGITFGGWKSNDFLTTEVDCQHEFTRAGEAPSLAVQFGVRLGLLLEADGYIISSGSSEGTMVELMAIVTARKFNSAKRTAILRIEECPGWNEQMLDTLHAWGVLPDAVRQDIRVVTTPEEAVAWVTAGK